MLPQSKYNLEFQNALAKLNPSQLQAVNQIEGPVLVIAGPGTGKTQILAARIGNILTKTDVQAHNILCLTYTDAGAVAMRKRLFEFIGPEAHRVNIYTFHAFCNDIIQENLDFFGKLNLDPVSDLERIELFRELVNNFAPNHILKRFRGDVYYEIKRLQELFSIMKRESWSPDFISSKIDEFKELIENCEPGSPYYKEYKYQRKQLNNEVGSLKPKFTNLCDDLEKLRAAVYEFPNYQALMQKRNLYDYDDMILWVIDAFKKDENLLLNYQEKYQYILVDEYQDTSGSQNELINLLISYWDKPNIFVVGDDDQSIFRFQGANVENIEAYNQQYANDLYRVMLTDNYRSSQQILDVSRQLISHKSVQVNLPGLDKNLVSKNDRFIDNDVHPQLLAYPTQFHEFAAITHKISELIVTGTPAEEIAVIYKEHRSGQELARYFQLKNIPVMSKRKVNILTDPFGKKLITILRYIALENDIPYSGDELLFKIMHYDFYDIEPIDVAKISVEVADKRFQKNKTSIREQIHALAAKTGQSLFDTESHKQLKRLSNDLEFWIKESNNLTLQNLFEKIMVRGGILAYVMRSADKTRLMQMLSSLFNYLKEESRKKPSLNLKEFVAILDLLQENDLPLELNQTIFNQQGVNFLTCHGSKGLEFEHVFFMGCNKNVWEKKRKSATAYKLPDTVYQTFQQLGNDEEELRRLFYVALTRAKKHLEISYHQFDAKGKDLEPTVFIGEILAKTELQIRHPETEDERLFEFFELQFAEQQKPQMGLIDHDFVAQRLQNYALSVTHLNNYLDCPLKFYFQNLVLVPSGKNETMTFGSAVHWALNKLFRALPENDNQFLGIDAFLADFDWYMLRNREAFTSEQFKRRMEYGHKILPEYYSKYADVWQKVSLTEYPVKNVEVNGVPIKGAIDKLEFTGKTVNVVDYKTGSYERAKAKFKVPDDQNPLGGDYWRQAVFYKILLDNDKRKDWEVISSEFDFIEPEKGEYEKHQVYIRPQDLEIVTQQITDTYQKIQNHEFTGCGKKDCSWCSFVKTNFRQAENAIASAAQDEENEI